MGDFHKAAASGRGPRRHRRRLYDRSQNLALKVMPDFQWMPKSLKARPRARQLNTQLLQRRQSLLIRQLTRPDPLHVERRFAPTVGAPAVQILHGHPYARTAHAGERLTPE